MDGEKHEYLGSRDSTVLRALVSHQCVPGFPGPRVICGLSLWLVLFLAPRGFSPGTPASPLLKTNISKFRFDLDYCQALNHGPLARVLAKVIYIIQLCSRLMTVMLEESSMEKLMFRV